MEAILIKLLCITQLQKDRLSMTEVGCSSENFRNCSYPLSAQHVEAASTSKSAGDVGMCEETH